MPGTLPNIVGVSTPLSFPVIFEALAYCYYDSHFTDVRTERLSNLPKVTQQSHKLNLGSIYIFTEGLVCPSRIKENSECHKARYLQSHKARNTVMVTWYDGYNANIH